MRNVLDDMMAPQPAEPHTAAVTAEMPELAAQVISSSQQSSTGQRLSSAAATAGGRVETREPNEKSAFVGG